MIQGNDSSSFSCMSKRYVIISMHLCHTSNKISCAQNHSKCIFWKIIVRSLKTKTNLTSENKLYNFKNYSFNI